MARLTRPFTQALSALPVLLLALGTALTARAETPPLDIGDAVPPGLTLKTEKGTPFDLSTALTRQPTVLVFYRGGWCPYCNAHLAALAEIEGDLQKAGIRLIAISPDQPSKLYDAPERKTKPDFLLLSDQDMTAAEAFGIAFTVSDDVVARYKKSFDIDLEEASGRKHHRLPYPSVFVVDTTGVIRFAHVNPDYRTRLEPAKILAAARAALPKS
jgi:peroxiredoxin